MSPKLAYNSLEWGPTPDLELMLEEIRDAGWDGWEVRQPLDWLGAAARVERLSRQAGLHLAAVCGQGSGFAGDRVALGINQRRIELAAEVGADAFLFMAPARPHDRSPTPGEIDLFAEFAEQLALFGDQLGMDVTFHFHTGQLVHTEAEVKRVMAQAPHLKLCVDLSHAQLIDWDPHRCLREFKGRIAYMHLQDFKGWRYVNIGDGDIFESVPSLFETMDEIGYDRWLGCHGGHQTDQTPKERAIQCRRYLKSIKV